jgi:predicted lipoprotein with Yx(FWY)xxD motif
MRDDSAHGQILVDGAGLTLYIFDRDTEGVSNCAGGCLNAWPPFYTDGAPAAGSGVAAEIGAITLADGKMQVTVNGFPAYYWQGDAAAGDTNGNGVSGVWWVFNPDGSPQRPAKVGMAENATHGNILVDGAGSTVYIFDRDTPGVSNCTGGCIAAWPPLLTEYPPVALTGVEAEIGTITLADGSMQVTVNGYPAYYWQGDAAAGDTNGNGVNNVWWVFNADGSPQRPSKVGLAENALGDILVDGAGYTLYLFDNDTAGVSTCSGTCLVNWPPLLTGYAPVALTDVTAEIGQITREDGSTQVTVNGLPAYYWQGDAEPGDTDGQGRGGVWWVMTADGSAIRN